MIVTSNKRERIIFIKDIIRFFFFMKRKINSTKMLFTKISVILILLHFRHITYSQIKEIDGFPYNDSIWQKK